MLRDAVFIARSDVRHMLRARETLVWVFLMPIVFFYFIGTITAGFGGGGGGERKDALVLEEGDGAGFLADQVVKRLEERDYRIVRPGTEEESRRYSRHLTLPGAFTDSVLAGVPVTVEFTHGRERLGADYENLRVGRAIYTVLADVVVSGEMGAEADSASLARLNGMPRALTLEVEPAGRRKRIPHGFEQAVPGILVMFVLLVMTTSGAVLLVVERNEGLLRRLACTPIDRTAVVLGKWGGKLSLGIVQIVFAMIAGTVLFHMDWGKDLAVVVGLLVVYAGMMASLGMLLGSLARTEGQAVAVGIISSNALAALGGCWWPIEIVPPWMQKLQLFLPTGWAMNAMHKLVSFGAGPASVAPHVLGMAAAALVLMLLTVRVFRFE